MHVVIFSTVLRDPDTSFFTTAARTRELALGSFGCLRFEFVQEGDPEEHDRSGRCLEESPPMIKNITNLPEFVGMLKEYDDISSSQAIFRGEKSAEYKLLPRHGRLQILNNPRMDETD